MLLLPFSGEVQTVGVHERPQLSLDLFEIKPVPFGRWFLYPLFCRLDCMLQIQAEGSFALRLAGLD